MTKHLAASHSQPAGCGRGWQSMAEKAIDCQSQPAGWLCGWE